MLSVKENWETYLLQVLPSDLTEDQKADYKRIWYASAASVLEAIAFVAETDQDAGTNLFLKFQNEIQEYFEQFKTPKDKV